MKAHNHVPQSMMNDMQWHEKRNQRRKGRETHSMVVQRRKRRQWLQLLTSMGREAGRLIMAGWGGEKRGEEEGKGGRRLCQRWPGKGGGVCRGGGRWERKREGGEEGAVWMSPATAAGHRWGKDEVGGRGWWVAARRWSGSGRWIGKGYFGH